MNDSNIDYSLINLEKNKCKIDNDQTGNISFETKTLKNRESLKIIY